MTNTDTIKINGLVVFKQNGLWIVRRMSDRKELAHESNKADALKAARKLSA